MRRAVAVGLLGWMGCAQPEPLVNPVDGGEIFKTLHTPIYDVFSLGTDRDAVHALLASAFTDEALTHAYVEHWRTLVQMGKEDTSILVTGVEYGAVELLPPEEVGVMRVDASWSVRGVVRHRQHRHPRINRYRAVYTLWNTEAGWRVGATRMKDVERVATLVQGDQLFDPGAGSGADEGFMDPLEMFEAGMFEETPP